MNELNKYIISNYTFEYCNKNQTSNSNIKLLTTKIIDFLFNLFIEKNLTAIKIFKIFILGFIHSREQKTYGVLAGFFNLHFQLTMHTNSIYSIVILKILSIGIIQNDDKNAIGIIITLFGMNIQFMIGINKTPIIGKNKLSQNKNTYIIGEA